MLHHLGDKDGYRLMVTIKEDRRLVDAATVSLSKPQIHI